MCATRPKIEKALNNFGEGRRRTPLTLADRTRKHLRHLLEWADGTALPRTSTLALALPAYLVDKHLSPSSIKKGLECTRHFYTFARDHWPQRYRNIPPSWISMLQPPRGARMESRLQVHQYYSLDNVLRIVSVSTETLRQEKAKAAVCFLFLSGMRADAFASLPIECVDLERRQISQLPEKGVRTKNRKAALTYLLDVPELLAVVERWDRSVRDLPPAALWYSPVTRDGMTLVPTTRAHAGRGNQVGKDLEMICNLAGIPYLSPHKLRHGHVVYALKQARTMAELKAISQNVMHASVTITDQVYGQLVSDDVRTIINGLGAKSQVPDGLPVEKLAELLELLKQVTGQT